MSIIPQAFVTWLVAILVYFRVVDGELTPVYCFVARAFLGLLCITPIRMRFFQPELLIISGDVNVNPRPVNKRNQGRPTAPTCPVCEKAVAKNQRQFTCWMCRDMTHVKCSSSKADFRVLVDL